MFMTGNVYAYQIFFKVISKDSCAMITLAAARHILFSVQVRKDETKGKWLRQHGLRFLYFL